ncbi:hypothetical protein V3C33_02695 [Micrococcaceae bacterium Sec5.7]
MGILATLLASIIVAPSSNAAGPIVDWDADGVGVWREDPATGNWIDMPFEVDAVQKRFKYEMLCIVNGQNDVDPACIARANCNQGEDGRPVRWFDQFTFGDPNVWQAIEPDRCLYSEKPEDVLDKIAAQIQSKFEQLPILAGSSVVQPSPHTLKGAETNFYAEASKQSFTVDMLGQSVAVVAKPVQYRWDYGDGASFGPTATSGGSLPQDRWGEKTRTSHIYPATGDFRVTLTTYFQGTYSVNGGPALPIPAQGQFSAPPQTMSVWRSITRNYADDCNVNPQGQGCPGVAPSVP